MQYADLIQYFTHEIGVELAPDNGNACKVHLRFCADCPCSPVCLCDIGTGSLVLVRCVVLGFLSYLDIAVLSVAMIGDLSIRPFRMASVTVLRKILHVLQCMSSYCMAPILPSSQSEPGPDLPFPIFASSVLSISGTCSTHMPCLHIVDSSAATESLTSESRCVWTRTLPTFETDLWNVLNTVFLIENRSLLSLNKQNTAKSHRILL